MKFHVSSLVPDHVVLRELGELVSQERASCAEALVRIAEVEVRRLYAPAGYSSMQAYCVGELCMSEDEANKRIRVARAAREFPAIFPALADGRLHTTGVLLLAPHLTKETADDLLATAAGQTKAAIERLIAERFPRPDVPTRLGPLESTSCGDLVAPERVEEFVETAESMGPLRLVEPAGSLAPARIDAPPRYPRITPLSADRDAFQCTLRRETSELLRYAQVLLSHTIPSGDLAEVIHRCLTEAVQQIEKRRLGAGSRSQAPPRRKSGPSNPRVIPMHVRREVWLRDGGRCTFTSDRGHRCEATHLLEFHHIVSVTRGGETTAENLRLRCRTHNQSEAERELGAGFMAEKREAARARTQQARAQKNTKAAKPPARPSEARPSADTAECGQPSPPAVPSMPLTTPATSPQATAPDLEVMPWLRQLRFSATEARRGAELCAHMRDAPLDQRVRFAIASLAPAHALPTAPTAWSAP